MVSAGAAVTGITIPSTSARSMCISSNDDLDLHFNRLVAVHHESLSAVGGGGGTGHVESGGGTSTLAKVTG